jgi:hypothetical protein
MKQGVMRHAILPAFCPASIIDEDERDAAPDRAIVAVQGMCPGSGR